MKFKELFESRKMPKYGWVNFNQSKNDAKSVINKLKKEYPGYKFGIKNNKIHMNGKTIFDLMDSPMNYFSIMNKVNDLVNEDEAEANIKSDDIAETPARIGKNRKRLQRKKNPDCIGKNDEI